MSGEPKLRRRYHPLGWSIDDVFLDGKLIGFVIHREGWEASDQRGDALGTADLRRAAVQMVMTARLVRDGEALPPTRVIEVGPGCPKCGEWTVLLDPRGGRDLWECTACTYRVLTEQKDV